MPKSITIQLTEEMWDPVKEEFIPPFTTTIVIEHSLYAISLWESKYLKSFFKKDGGPQTEEEILDYIKFMTITENVDPSVYTHLSQKNLEEIFEYMNYPMTATVIKPDKGPQRSSSFVTNELVYFWMASYQIPFTCDRWHFNRLMTLIQVANEKNKPKDKKSRHSTIKDYAAMNAARRKKLGTKG